MTELVLLWLATYALHSTVLLGAVWLLERAKVLALPEVREWAWRLALFGAIATSLAQAGWSVREPLTATPEIVAAMSSSAALPTSAVAATRPVPLRASAPHAVATTTAATKTTPFAFALPATLPSRGIVLVWAALALAGALLTIGRAWALSRRARTLPRCADPRIEREVSDLAAHAGIAPPRVALLEDGGSPLVAPLARLCLPAWTLSRLDARQRAAMLAHEIAHVRRRDPLWRIAIELACRALLFQPLNRLAARRLDALAELACDAWAARVRDPRALAECLVACAEHIHTDAPALATAMARRRSPLLERIHLLIEESPMPNRLRTLTLRAALVAALPAVLFLPAIGIQRIAAAGEAHGSIQIHDGLFAKSMSLDIGESDGLRLRAKVKGEIRFNADESDVVEVSDNAWIEEIRGGVRRRIELESGKGGNLARSFYLDGKEQPFDAGAQRWLAQVIPALMRESGYEAEARVARIHQRGGADAVLAEVALVHSDYVRRSYLVALAKLGALSEGQVGKALALVVPMSSDYERREALLGLIETQALTASDQVAVLDVVSQIGSDYEKRSVLSALAAKLLPDAAVHAGWAKALATVESDYEARESIAALAARDDLKPDLLEAMLQSAGKIGSDFEQRSALATLAPHLKRLPQLATAYARATASIGSDYERREALSALLDAVDLDAAGYAAVLDAIAGIGSDYDCRSALVDVAARMPADAALIKRYREIARKLGDYERGQAEKALDRFASL